MKSNFSEHAEKAAELERDGQFIKAAFAWECAKQFAKNAPNRLWAEFRSDRCNAQAKRKFKGKA